jgi:hypothetical protein
MWCDWQMVMTVMVKMLGKQVICMGSKLMVWVDHVRRTAVMTEQMVFKFLQHMLVLRLVVRILVKRCESIKELVKPAAILIKLHFTHLRTASLRSNSFSLHPDTTE